MGYRIRKEKDPFSWIGGDGYYGYISNVFITRNPNWAIDFATEELAENFTVEHLSTLFPNEGFVILPTQGFTSWPPQSSLPT